VVAQVQVTQQFIPLLGKVRTRIVNIGSTAGFSLFRFWGPTVSKFAMAAVSDI
jgi:hypothetical protein